MRAESFFACKAKPDIWMQLFGNHYKYVAVYIDNLTFAVDDPKAFVTNFQDKHNFKLKETGPLEFHLRANFAQDQDRTLSMSPKIHH